ncbi:MAG: DUF2231 domain-containing protein [Gemmatimonadales bacterium]
MIPDPLHPALVHFPIVLAVLLPIAAAITLWAIRRGANPRRSWAVPVALAAALALSAWASVQTGEAEEDRVESVVPEVALETHEEAADRFLLLSFAVLAVTAAGLIGGKAGGVARIVGLAAALALAVAGYQVGHSGGELVYRHGAASAYRTPDGLGVPRG